MPMNVNDLKDLIRVAETLRYHYGSTMWMKHPTGGEFFNVVTQLEAICQGQIADRQNHDAPRRRHVESSVLARTQDRRSPDGREE